MSSNRDSMAELADVLFHVGVDLLFIGSWAHFLMLIFFPPFWGQIVGRKSYEKRAKLFIELCGL
jgi:hypothetical protein